MITTMTLMVMVVVKVVETMLTLEIPLTLKMIHQLHLATTQGEQKKGLPVEHQINKLLIHLDHIYQEQGFGIEVIPLNLYLVILMLVLGQEVLLSINVIMLGFFLL